VRIPAALLFLVSLAACGASPAAAPSERPSGTLVVVIRQGPDRVPFQPKVDRIRRANEQLASILGHSIQIELDGSLLPQDHDGAQDVIARLVETVARDIDALKREDPRALPFAQGAFERLVVRYAPTEAAQRAPAQAWRRSHSHAKLDVGEKTIDIVLAEARWLALEHGDIAAPLLDAFGQGQDSRYANSLPDKLPASEHAAWIAYHAHSNKNDLGSINTLNVRGLVMLSQLPEARKQLIDHELGNFSSTYHHHAPEVEAAAPASPFKQAETAFVGWLNRELPRMTPEERDKVARAIFVFDFRKPSGDRDRFASYAFPGFDPMAFGLGTIDRWIAEGHPTKSESFDTIVSPAHIEAQNGEMRLQHDGRGDGVFYRWAFGNAQREDTFASAMVKWSDGPALTTGFYNARRALHDESEYLRFLRRFEQKPASWKIGADVFRAETYRPSTQLLAESRRQWREVPTAQGHALFYFARAAEASYHADEDWEDMLQAKKADENALAATLDLGWPAFELLPVMWPALARSGRRVTTIEAHAHTLLDQNVRAFPGHKDVAGTLATVAQLLCDEHAMAELAELRAFAQKELAARPGAGLSDVVEATDPAKCHPKPARTAPPRKPVKPKWKEGDPLPPKEPQRL